LLAQQDPGVLAGTKGKAESFYDILEVSRSASPEMIVAAYEALTRVHSAKAASGDADAANHL